MIYKRIIIALVAVAVAGAIWYAPHYLAYADQPVKSDVIVLFIGSKLSTPLRHEEAFKLIEEGYAQHFLIPAYGQVFDAHAVSRFHELSNPDANGLFNYPRFYEDTHREILEAKKMMDKTGFKSAILMSSPYHMRRIRIIARKAYQTGDYRLAFVPSRYEQTVLLVDCDLRQQNVHRVLGFDNDKGLLDYLIDNKPVSELMVWPGIDKLTLISGGRVVHESTELLGSPRMKDLVADMKTRYPDRFVFFDVPPILVGADALAFAPLVDFIIMVVHAGATSTQDVKKALELIPSEKVIGFVLNRHNIQTKTYPVQS